MQWDSPNHTISDLRDWNNERKLVIRPDFQRRAVWSKAAKVMLIDTIIKNIPMPKLYLERKVSSKEPTYRIVIDGQQRITTILEYIEGELVLPNTYEDKAWAGKRFDELGEEQHSIFLNYVLNINELTNSTDAEIRDLYSRVNKYTVQLNKQELRKCDYPGDFIELAEVLVTRDFFEEARVFTAAMTRRMTDVEFVEELLMILLEGMQDKKSTIDDFCERYKKIDDRESLVEEFDKCLWLIDKLFGEIKLSETRFRQRTDLYSLFAVVYSFDKDGKSLKPDLQEVQNELLVLDKEITPKSDNKEYSEYAIRCTSDANSYSSRKWRYDFLRQVIRKAFEE